MSTLRPFTVAWDDAAVGALLDQVRAARPPDVPAEVGWSAGCDRDFLVRLREHWLDGYDWRAAAAELNRYPQFLVDVDGLDVHVVHVRGEGPGRPLLVTHGWPGSYYEFWEVVERLTYPSRFGGDARDAVDLVLPSLPGFAFSGKRHPPPTQRQTARIWRTLMTEHLGYDRFLAQGGDWGAIVTSWLGFDHPDAVAGIHLNMLAFRSALPPRDDEERAWAAAAARAQQRLGAYSTLQTTKPQSLVWVSAGNPLGQAAWIVERFHDWADLRARPFEEVFSLDQLLTNVMLYVMTDSFASAAWFYPGVTQDPLVLPEGVRCEVPTAYADFPGDSLLPSPPRQRVELTYALSRWTSFEHGGHFAAMEAPVAFADDVLAWAREAWPG